MQDTNDDSRTDKRRRHERNMEKKGRCTLCPPHDGENTTRSKRGVKKPRKDKNR